MSEKSRDKLCAEEKIFKVFDAFFYAILTAKSFQIFYDPLLFTHSENVHDNYLAKLRDSVSHAEKLIKNQIRMNLILKYLIFAEN